jgi:hypothetical protein
MLFLVCCFLACSEQKPVEKAKLSQEEEYAQRIEEGGALLELSLIKGERLANIYQNKNNKRADAAFLIHSYEGYYFQQSNKKSIKFKRLLSTIPTGEGEEFIAHVVDSEDNERLIFISGGEYQFSEVFDSLRYGTDYGVNNDKKSWIGRLAKKSRVVFFDKQFDYGPNVKKIRSIEPTPDLVSVQYHIERSKYGVGKSQYDSKPSWLQLDEKWMFTAKKNKKSALVINHLEKGLYSKIGSMVSYGEDKRVVFSAVKSKKNYVVSVSGVTSEEELIEHGPFDKVGLVRGRIPLHAHSNLPQFIGKSSKEVEGKSTSVDRLFYVSSKHSWESSSPYKSLSFEADLLLDRPIAKAKTEDGVLLLRGIVAGPNVSSISSIQSCFQQQKVTYIATLKNDEQAVLINEEQGEGFAKVRSLKTTPESKTPYYIGKTIKLVDEKDTSFESVVRNTDKSPLVDSVGTVITRLDDVLWLSKTQDKNAVGINVALGEKFDQITSIQTTKASVLWYKAKNNEKFHMVIETDSSRGYSKISNPLFTDLSAHILYSGRVLKDPPEEGFYSSTDYVVINNKDVSSFNQKPGDASASKKLLSGTFSPSLKIVRKTDSYYYKAQENEVFFVGWNKEKPWGAFDQASSLTVLPDRSGLAYVATKNEKQAVHVNGDRHQEYDSVASLRFTKDKLYVRYQAKQEGIKYEIVRKEQYLKVKEEKLNRNGDIFVYQGETEKGWAQFVNYEGSQFFTSLSRVSFSPDGYGVEVAATSEKGAHFFHKFHDESFVAEKPFKSISSRSRYYLPHAAAPVFFKGEEKGVYHIGSIDENGEKQYLNLPDVQEKVFLAAGRNANNPTDAWIIEKIENNKLFVRNGPTEKFVNKLNASIRKSFYVLPLRAPYQYGAQQKKQRGVVFEEKFYKSLDNEMFTRNRKLVLRGKVSGGMQLVFEGSRTSVFGSINKKYYFHESPNSEDLFAFLTYSSAKKYSAEQQLVVTNNKAETQSFGYHSRVSFGEWTPLSKRNEHTIVWNGPDFVAVGSNHYDRVRKVGISPNLEHLNYVASKDDFELIYHKNAEGKKYKSIQEYSLKGTNDDASYVGEHILSKKDQVQKVDVVSQERSIFHIVQGENTTDWYESIQYFLAGDSFEDASFAAKRKGAWMMYKGKKSISPSFHDIAWFHRTEDSKIHFMGRDRKGWHEFHNGTKKRTVSSLLPLPTHNVPDSWSPLSGRSASALVNEKGEFIYAAVGNGNEVLYHADKEHQPVHNIHKFWVFEYGVEEEKKEVLLTVHQRKDQLKYLVVGEKKSEMFDSIIGTPQVFASTGTVYTVVDKGSLAQKKRSALIEKDESLAKVLQSSTKEDVQRKFTEKKIAYPYSKALLNGTKSMLTADDIAILDLKTSGPVCSISDLEGNYIFHSGQKGPVFQSLHQSIWGESLAQSRYIYANSTDDVFSKYVGSTKQLLGPFDNGTLVQKEIQKQSAFIFVGTNNHKQSLFINEKEVLNSSKITDIREYGSDLVVDRVDLNTSLVSLGDQPFDSVYQLPTSKIEVDGNKFELLLRKEQDVFTVQFDSKISNEADLLWDMKSSIQEDDIVWSWLSGEIDYSGAKVQVFEKTLRIPKETKAVALENLKAPKEKVDEEVASQKFDDEEQQVSTVATESNKSTINVKEKALSSVVPSMKKSKPSSIGKKRKRGSLGRTGGSPTILGGLDKSLIDAVIKRKISQIRLCYQRQLAKNPSLSGKIKVKFVVATDGSVSKASIDSSTMGGGGKPVESCIVGSFKKFKFPQPNGGIVIVKYPFIFG